MFIGIDTASVAGNKKVDWGKAKAAGISYAIVRAAYGTSKDTMFDTFWPAIKNAGIVRGAYLFLRFPKDGKPAPKPKAQAEAVCRFVGSLNHDDFPVSLDVEFPGSGKASTGMSSRQLLDGVQEAWEILKNNYGVAPIVYTSARVWLDDLSNLPAPWAVESILWLARYSFSDGNAVLAAENISNPPVPPPWAGTDAKSINYRGTQYTNDNWMMHQYQGNATACPGFPSGNVDMNRTRPISKGSSGERVKWLQRRLGFTGKNVDGKFGPKTDEAVRAFQKDKPGVTADGIVGPRTLAYLCWENP